jgi:glycosyltransferase involved in cell wall biosynthesis
MVTPAQSDAMTRPPPRVLIIVQNLPVPFDRRVWLECRALVDAGFDVSVVCPKAPGDPDHQVLDAVEIDRYRPYPPTRRKLGFLAEYAYSFVMTSRLALRAWRRHRFDIVQTCNPPDIFWPLGLVFRLLGRARFVYDQHDLCPELYESRFPDGPRFFHGALRLMELCTYCVADHVIATNGSYREVAIRRGGKSEGEVTVVRSGPDPARLRKRAPDPALRRGRRFLVCYVGVMGPQDGVDIVLRAADVIVRELGRNDICFTLMGTGDCIDELLALREELGLRDWVHFTGRVPDDVVFSVLSTADIGLSPDPKNPLNDVSTMNKTMEYMSFELPVVAFDLRETRVSAADAALYVPANDVAAYARAIVDLLDDAPQRRSMGALGRARIESALAWRHQRDRYVGVYERLAGRGTAPGDDRLVEVVLAGRAARPVRRPPAEAVAHRTANAS